MYAYPPVWFLLLLCAGALYAQGDADTPFRSFDQRLNHYYYRTYSWQRLTLLGADTGIDYLISSKADWGAGAAGYGGRYGSGFGRRVVQNSLELGFSTVLRQDTRFRESNLKGFRRRAWYAVVHAFAATSPDGRSEFAWSRLLATAGATAITAGWKPRAVTGGCILGSMQSGMMSHIQNSLLTEFSPDLKRVGLKLRRKLFKK